MELALRRRDDEGEPDVPGADEAELHLNRLAEIITEIPARAEAVRARLAAQLGQSAVPDAGTDLLSGGNRELMAIMDTVNTLVDLTGNSSADSPETITRWRQLAGDCIARAESLRSAGRPGASPGGRRPGRGGRR